MTEIKQAKPSSAPGTWSEQFGAAQLSVLSRCPPMPSLEMCLQVSLPRTYWPISLSPFAPSLDLFSEFSSEMTTFGPLQWGYILTSSLGGKMGVAGGRPRGSHALVSSPPPRSSCRCWASPLASSCACGAGWGPAPDPQRVPNGFSLQHHGLRCILFGEVRRNLSC